MSTVANQIIKRENSVQMEVSFGPKPFLTPDEFQTAMGNTIGRASIYKLLAAGRIKHVRVGRKYLIPTSELVEFAEREAEGVVGA